MSTQKSNTVPMIRVQQLSHGYIRKNLDPVHVHPDQLARMSFLISVECTVGHKLVREQLVGYREADSGCVMVSQEQFNQYFS